MHTGREINEHMVRSGEHKRFEDTWEFVRLPKGLDVLRTSAADFLVIHYLSSMHHRKQDIDRKNDVEVRIRLEFEPGVAYSE